MKLKNCCFPPLEKLHMVFEIRHSTLQIPTYQWLKNYKPLVSSGLNTLRCKLHTVKVILLYEISMVGSTTLNVQINNRFKGIKASKEPF